MKLERKTGPSGWFFVEVLPDGSEGRVILAQGQPVPAALAHEIADAMENHSAMNDFFHDMLVGQQAAWIEWQRGAGAEAGMKWIHNGLAGPGLIPPEDAAWAKEPQAFFDANRASPFPTCHCGRPSNILWMSKGFCCREHYDAHRNNLTAEADTANDAAGYGWHDIPELQMGAGKDGIQQLYPVNTTDDDATQPADFKVTGAVSFEWPAEVEYDPTQVMGGVHDPAKESSA